MLSFCAPHKGGWGTDVGQEGQGFIGRSRGWRCKSEGVHLAGRTLARKAWRQGSEVLEGGGRVRSGC